MPVAVSFQEKMRISREILSILATDLRRLLSERYVTRHWGSPHSRECNDATDVRVALIKAILSSRDTYAGVFRVPFLHAIYDRHGFPDAGFACMHRRAKNYKFKCTRAIC